LQNYKLAIGTSLIFRVGMREITDQLPALPLPLPHFNAFISFATLVQKKVQLS